MSKYPSIEEWELTRALPADAWDVADALEAAETLLADKGTERDIRAVRRAAAILRGNP